MAVVVYENRGNIYLSEKRSEEILQWELNHTMLAPLSRIIPQIPLIYGSMSSIPLIPIAKI